MLKILSWNIRQGGGSRINKIIGKIAALSPEIVVFSEFRNNEKGNKLRAELLRLRYRFQNVSGSSTDENSVIIASKILCNHYVFPNSDTQFQNNIICSEFNAFKVYGMYLPHKKKHKLFEFLHKTAEDENPGILVGDFNTGHNHIDQKGDSFWYTAELRKLESLGYIDAFRLLHGDVKEYSWYSHQGNGYRYDHTYCKNDLKSIIKKCYYLHQWREEGISDHSPMVVELG